jgi:hypothetical protein
MLVTTMDIKELINLINYDTKTKDKLLNEYTEHLKFDDKEEYFNKVFTGYISCSTDIMGTMRIIFHFCKSYNVKIKISIFLPSVYNIALHLHVDDMLNNLDKYESILIYDNCNITKLMYISEGFRKFVMNHISKFNLNDTDIEFTIKHFGDIYNHANIENKIDHFTLACKYKNESVIKYLIDKLKII